MYIYQIPTYLYCTAPYKKTNEASQLTYMYIVHTLARLIVIFLSRAKKYYNKPKVHNTHGYNNTTYNIMRCTHKNDIIHK